jgi:hypothetical protein
LFQREPLIYSRNEAKQIEEDFKKNTIWEDREMSGHTPYLISLFFLEKKE